MVGRKLQGSCSSRGEKNDLEVCALFVSKRRGYVLEALEKIKIAEEQNELKKESLKSDLASYEAAKKQELQIKKGQLKEIFSSMVDQKAYSLAESLAAEKQKLAEVAEVETRQMEEKYSVKKSQMIQMIVERVITEYGSQ
ncbi:hypothetical protein ACQKTA_04790 [Enterococcus sp. 22-H-5-01]|uniref:hypothetical protein n=1 Tax=Enterococcus sp. 22-H-5-01 TaxID=3418555 RepID=UPI003CFE0091